MKSPHNQRPDDEAHADTEAFIAKYTRRPGTDPAAARRPGAAGESSELTSSHAPAPALQTGAGAGGAA